MNPNPESQVVGPMRDYLEGEKHLDSKAMEAAVVRFQRTVGGQFSKERKPRDQDEIKLYPSEAGKCERAILYKALGIPGEPFMSDVRFKFAMGDLVELLVVYLIGHAKGISLTDNNTIMEIQIGSRKWRGASDGIVKCLDGKKRNLEVKSTSKWGFKFTKERGVDDNFGYLTQACVLTRHMMQEKLIDVPETVFVYVDRDSMHFHEEIVVFDDFSLAHKADLKFDRVLQAIKDKKVPKRPYQLQKGKLGLQCSYCSHKFTCWVRPHQAVTFEMKEGRPEPVYRVQPTQYLNTVFSRGKPNWILVGNAE